MSFFRNRFNATRRAASNAASGFANTTRRVYQGISSGISSAKNSLASTLGLDFSQTKLVKGNVETTVSKQLVDIGKLLNLAVEHGLQERVAGLVQKLIQLLGDSMSPELTAITEPFKTIPPTREAVADASTALLAAGSISNDPIAIAAILNSPDSPSSTSGGGRLNATIVVALNLIRVALIIVLIVCNVSFYIVARIVNIGTRDAYLIKAVCLVIKFSFVGLNKAFDSFTRPFKDTENVEPTTKPTTTYDEETKEGDEETKEGDEFDGGRKGGTNRRLRRRKNRR